LVEDILGFDILMNYIFNVNGFECITFPNDYSQQTLNIKIDKLHAVPFVAWFFFLLI